MRFIGRREGVAAELVERMDWAEAHDRRQRADHALRRLQLRRAGGDRRRGAKLRGRAPRRSSARHLYAPEMHDPDLLIRTSGEQRISNFLLWQCAYSELVFSDALWPDFGRDGVRGGAGRVRDPPAAVRRAVAMEGSRPFDSELDFDHPRRNRPAPPPPLAAERARRRRRTRRRRAAEAPRSETLARIAWALPWIAIVVTIAIVGGELFAAAMIGFACVGIFELFRMTARRAAVPDRRLRRRRRARRRGLLRRPVPDDDRAGGERAG